MTENLRELLVKELGDLLDAEQQIIKALPKMATAASTKDLVTAFTDHLEETKEHVVRLKEVFKMLDEKVETETCKAMNGLIAEGESIIKEEMDDLTKDAALIAAAQKVEHYEIASYGTLRTFARTMGLDDVADMLQTTLDEEGAADEKLTEIAEESINEASASASV